MKLVKERNFINAYEGGEKLGGWNITTGEFIGKSGKVVKTVPACFTYNRLRRFYQDLLSGAIYMYREYWTSPYSYHGPYTSARANRLEQMISVGIYPSSERELDSTIPLTKELVNWIKSDCENVYINGRVNQYLLTIQYNTQLPENAPKWVYDAIPILVKNNVPATFFIPAIRRAISEGVDFIVRSQDTYRKTNIISELLIDYYKYSMEMWEEVEVKPNIISMACKIRKLYEEYKDEHFNERLKLYNDKPWLYFENDIFIAKPLLTKREFHDEAVAQNNCVERIYASEVFDGKTHIVSIRYKDNPEKSYITCEVTNDGKINQFLTYNNEWVSNNDALAFKDMYVAHIQANIEK